MPEPLTDRNPQRHDRIGRIGERVDTDPDTGGANRSAPALTEGDVSRIARPNRTLIGIGRSRAMAATEAAADRFRAEELRRQTEARRLVERAALEAQWAQQQAALALGADARIESMYGGYPCNNAVEEALFVRGYDAGKNSWQTAPIWPVKHDKDMEACEDMNDKSKPALSLVTPQARHHFTRLDQVNQLVRAGESDSEIGYMGRLMALCSLPRTNPGQRKEFTRVNGPYQLYMIAGPNNKLPFGHIPRLLLAWVCTEAVRTQSRSLVLGKKLSTFMRLVGIDPAGASYARVRNQMKRLFACSIVLVYTDKDREAQLNTYFADRTDFWWNEPKPGQDQSTIELSEKFFDEIISHPVPLDMHILKALTRSALGLDLYLWLNYRTFALESYAEDFLEAVIPAVWSGPGQRVQMAAR